jgi:hypothetical protein
MIDDISAGNMELTEIDESEHQDVGDAAEAEIDAVFQDWDESAAPQAPPQEGQDGACVEGPPHADVEAAEKDADEADRKKWIEYWKKKNPKMLEVDETRGRTPLSSADMTAGIRG